MAIFANRGLAPAEHALPGATVRAILRNDGEHPQPRRSAGARRESAIVSALMAVLAAAALICLALSTPLLWTLLISSNHPIAAGPLTQSPHSSRPMNRSTE